MCHIFKYLLLGCLIIGTIQLEAQKEEELFNSFLQKGKEALSQESFFQAIQYFDAASIILPSRTSLIKEQKAAVYKAIGSLEQKFHERKKELQDVNKTEGDPEKSVDPLQFDKIEFLFREALFQRSIANFSTAIELLDEILELEGLTASQKEVIDNEKKESYDQLEQLGGDQAIFAELMNEGLEARDTFNFFGAIDKFNAALIFADIPGRSIVEIEIDRTGKLLQTFRVTIEDQRDSLEEVSKDLQLEIDKSQRLAEASKLALLSMFQKEQGKRTLALQLAVIADSIKNEIKKSDSLSLSFIEQAFGDAAYLFYRDSASWKGKGLQIEEAHFFKGSKDRVYASGAYTYAYVIDSNLAKNIGHKTEGNVLLAQANKKGDLIITGQSNQKYILWDLNSDNGKVLWQAPKRITGAQFSPDDQFVLTWVKDTIALLWDVEGRKEVQAFRHNKNILKSLFSPDGTKIATRSSDGVIKIWETLQTSPKAIINGHSNRVYGPVFSPNSQTLLSWSADHTAKVWDLDGNLLYELKGHTAPILTAAYSSDGEWIITGAADKTAILWNNKGKAIHQLMGHNNRIKGALFSPQNDKILTYDLDGKLKLWDLTGNLIADLNQHTGFITTAQFSRDGQTILSASNDGTAKLWNLAGELLMNMDGFQGRVSSASFSDDSTYILLGSVDESLIICPTLKQARILSEYLAPLSPETKAQFKIK